MERLISVFKSGSIPASAIMKKLLLTIVGILTIPIAGIGWIILTTIHEKTLHLGIFNNLE